MEWVSQCDGNDPCTLIWTPLNPEVGYKVEAYAFDKGGAMSEKLVNYMEYLCGKGLETDFTSLDFETVNYRTHKWIEGDYVWDDPKGPACKLGETCVGPTIRNIGNIPCQVSVLQDDMNFGFSGVDPKDWNVQWDARLGVYPNEVSIFDPEETVTLDGVLDLCQSDKISFSIYVKKMVETGPHIGEVILEPVCDLGENDS